MYAHGVCVCMYVCTWCVCVCMYVHGVCVCMYVHGVCVCGMRMVYMYVFRLQHTQLTREKLD